LLAVKSWQVVSSNISSGSSSTARFFFLVLRFQTIHVLQSHFFHDVPVNAKHCYDDKRRPVRDKAKASGWGIQSIAYYCRNNNKKPIGQNNDSYSKKRKLYPDW
jgi:hypothetical protein